MSSNSNSFDAPFTHPYEQVNPPSGYQDILHGDPEPHAHLSSNTGRTGAQTDVSGNNYGTADNSQSQYGTATIQSRETRPISGDNAAFNQSSNTSTGLTSTSGGAFSGQHGSNTTGVQSSNQTSVGQKAKDILETLGAGVTTGGFVASEAGDHHRPSDATMASHSGLKSGSSAGGIEPSSHHGISSGGLDSSRTTGSHGFDPTTETSQRSSSGLGAGAGALGGGAAAVAGSHHGAHGHHDPTRSGGLDSTSSPSSYGQGGSTSTGGLKSDFHELSTSGDRDASRTGTTTGSGSHLGAGAAAAGLGGAGAAAGLAAGHHHANTTTSSTLDSGSKGLSGAPGGLPGSAGTGGVYSGSTGTGIGGFDSTSPSVGADHSRLATTGASGAAGVGAGLAGASALGGDSRGEFRTNEPYNTTGSERHGKIADPRREQDVQIGGLDPKASLDKKVPDAKDVERVSTDGPHGLVFHDGKYVHRRELEGSPDHKVI